jgi:hypothetical protein
MANVYEIATKISMTNAVSPVLAVIAKEVLNLDGGIKNLQKSLGSLRGALAIGGGLALAGGVAMAAGLKNIADNARDLSHELTQLKKLNISADQLAQVRAGALGAVRAVPGTTETAALQTYGSAYSMFGHEGSLRLMRPLAEFAQVAGNTSGDYEKAEQNLYSMIRSGDLMGKFIDEVTHKVDPAKLEKFLDLGSKVILGTHGKVDSATWLGLAQQGGPALSQLSDKGLLTMAIASQAMGGPRAGTALTSLYQQMVGGKMTETAAKHLHDLGLVGDYRVSRGGHVVWNKGALDGEFTEKLKTDPLAAVGVMKAAMEKHGFDSIEKMVPELFQVLGRQTTQRLIHDLLRNYPQIMAERERIGGAMGVGDSKKVQNEQDYTQVEHNLEVAWKNLMLAIAGPNSENAIRLMKALTDALNSFSEKVRATNPDTLAKIGAGLGILSAALVGAGAAALVAALGTGGWVVLGIGALGAAFVVFKDDLAKLIPSASDAAHAIMGFIEAIKKIGSAIAEAISGAWNSFSHSEGGGGGGRGRSGIHYQNYRPSGGGGGSGTQPINLYIDGEPLHAAVIKAEYRASAHPRQAPSFDGLRHFPASDSQIWET